MPIAHACLQSSATAGVRATQETLIPVVYRGVEIDCGYRADLIVENELLLELKSVERLLPIKLRVGLLLNFNATSLRHGIRRLVR